MPARTDLRLALLKGEARANATARAEIASGESRAARCGENTDSAPRVATAVSSDQGW
jgi:hypothetical protein